MDETDTSSETGAEPPSPCQADQSGKPTIVDVVDPALLLAPEDGRWLGDRLRRALDRLGAWGEVRVRLVEDDRMARDHERYAGVAGTTDVLTFDLGGRGRSPLDVDLHLCVDEARRQAAARQSEPRRELLLYAIHGVLHCLGRDDHDEDSARAMHRTEDEILDAIGVGATFCPGSEGGDGAGGAAT